MSCGRVHIWSIVPFHKTWPPDQGSPMIKQANSCYCWQLQNHTYARVHILVDISWRDCPGKGMLILGQMEVLMLSLTLKPALPNAMTYSSRAWLSDALKSTPCNFNPPVALLKHRVSSHSHCCWLSPLNFCPVRARILDSVLCVSFLTGIEWQQTQTISGLIVCLFLLLFDVFAVICELLFCYCPVVLCFHWTLYDFINSCLYSPNNSL